VVFASAYRFSVLFSYTATDPTYTLAPTVGWTQIEMSAGIVSACLPTLRPVILLVGQSMGLKGSMFRSTNASTGMSKTGGGTNLGPVTGTRTALESKADGGKEGGGPFYRLPDDPNASAQRTTTANLRPDHGYDYSVSTSAVASRKGDGGSLSSGDEIPLQGIRVDTDFKHSSTAS
jgi:hypothetical protein